MKYLLFGTAVVLSSVAAYYSIIGLTAIFSASVVPIIIMGTILEFAKLVVAAWLYRSWDNVPLLLKTYFTIALVILMTLTSVSIFGFLSKAHLDQAIPTGNTADKVLIIDDKIKTEKDNILSAKATIKQLDSQVDQTIARSSDNKGTDRSIQIRRSQIKERSALLSEISSAQTKIAKLNDERAPIATELRKVEAEVGPIKYIAALIYGDALEQNMLEKAVRIVIIMIVIVFDPLAVLLLIAANIPIKRKEEINDTNATSTKETSTEAKATTSAKPTKSKSTSKASTKKSNKILGRQRISTNETSPPLQEEKSLAKDQTLLRSRVVKHNSIGPDKIVDKDD